MREGRVETQAPAELLDQGQDKVDGRAFGLDHATQFLHGTDQRVDLHGSALLQVLQHGGAMGAYGRRTVNPPLHIQGQLDTQASADRLGLQHDPARQGARVRRRSQHLQGLARERADGVEGHVPPQLEPDFLADVPHRGFQPRVTEQARKGAHPLRLLTAGLAEHETIAVEVLDHPGCGHLTGGVHHAPDRPLRPQPAPLRAPRVHAGQHAPLQLTPVAIEVPPGQSVNSGHHGRLFTQQGLYLLHSPRTGLGLQGHDHVVVHARPMGVVGARGMDMHHLAGAFDRDAVRLHRGQMGAPGNQRHFHPGLLQQRAHVATDGACAEHRNPHQLSPSACAKPMRCSLPVGPLGISATNTTRRGTLKPASRPRAKARNSDSSSVAPCVSTTAPGCKSSK